MRTRTLTSRCPLRPLLLSTCTRSGGPSSRNVAEETRDEAGAGKPGRIGTDTGSRCAREATLRVRPAKQREQAERLLTEGRTSKISGTSLKDASAMAKESAQRRWKYGTEYATGEIRVIRWVLYTALPLLGHYIRLLLALQPLYSTLYQHESRRHYAC